MPQTINGYTVPAGSDAVSTIDDTMATFAGQLPAQGTIPTSSGLNLVTPTSIANTGGSASIVGGSVVATGCGSISLNGVFNSTYANYRIVISDLVQVTAGGATLIMRMRAAGTDNAGSHGNFGTTRDYGGASTYGSYANTYFYLSQTGSYGSAHVVTDIFSPAKAAFTTATTNLAGRYGAGFNNIHYVLGHQHEVASAFDGFTLALLTSPTDTFSATLRVYGYKN